MLSNNLISKSLNFGRLFIPNNYFYIPLAGVKTKDAIELPEKPKKPLTSFFRFIQEHKAVLIRENPELKAKEIIKRCAEDWKNVLPTVKEKYENEYKAEMEIFTKKNLDFSMKLSDEQKEYLKKLSQDKINDTRKRKLRKKIKEMHKPKKPMSAFILFLMDVGTKEGRKINELMKEAKEMWYLLDNHEKNYYNEKAKQLMEQYKKDLDMWEKQMIEEGHADLVRSRVQEKKRNVSKKSKPKSSLPDNEINQE